jgi:hypothetical protein
MTLSEKYTNYLWSWTLSMLREDKLKEIEDRFGKKYLEWSESERRKFEADQGNTDFIPIYSGVLREIISYLEETTDSNTGVIDTILLDLENNENNFTEVYENIKLILDGIDSLYDITDDLYSKLYKVKYAEADPTAGYLGDKVSSGPEISLASDVTDPDNWKLKIENTGPFTRYNNITPLGYIGQRFGDEPLLFSGVGSLNERIIFRHDALGTNDIVIKHTPSTASHLTIDSRGLHSTGNLLMGTSTFISFDDDTVGFNSFESESSVVDWTEDSTIVSALAIENRIREPWIDIQRYGFLNQTETTLSFDGTSIFTLGSVGPSWSYYRSGIKYTITGSKTIDLLTIDNPLIDGAIYYIYIDSTNGALSASRTAWTLTDTKVPVALLLWNNTMTPKYWIGEERHSCLIDRKAHYYLHTTQGTKAKTIGSLTGYTLNTDNNTSKTFGIGTSIIEDEDINNTLSSLTDPNGSATDYVLMYRTGASSWEWKSSNMPFPYNIGNTDDKVQLDVSGTMTNVSSFGNGSNTRWVNSYVLFTNFAGSARFIILPGQNEYTTLSGAQAENPQSFTFTGIPIVEFVIAWRLTWSTVTSTSQGLCRLVDVSLVNSGVGTIGFTSPTDDHLDSVSFSTSTGDLTFYMHITPDIVQNLDGRYLLSSSYVNTTYDILAVTTTGGAYLRLHGSDSSTDDVKFAGSGGTTVAYTDDNTITISSTALTGYVTASGTPVNNQIAVWTDADTIEGESGLTWNGSSLIIRKDQASITTSYLYNTTISGDFSAGAAFVIGDNDSNNTLTFRHSGDGALHHSHIIHQDTSNSDLIIENVNSTGGILLKTNSNESLYVDENGRVSFGIDTPSYDFEISDGSIPMFTASKTTGSVKIGYSETGTPVKQLDIAGNVNFDIVTKPGNTMTGALAGVGAGNVDNGIHLYQVIYITADGQTDPQSSTVSVTVVDKTADGKVQLSNIPVSSDPRVTGRKIYRGAAGASSSGLYLLTTISDNITTTYLDNTADSGLSSTDRSYRKPNSTAGYLYTDSVLFAQAGNIYHTSFGVSALDSVTTGNSNAAFGGNALTAVNTGSNNVGVGYAAMENLSSGGGNVGLGYAALSGATTTDDNVAVGMNAGRYIADGTSTNTGPTGGTYLGYKAMASAVSLTNEIVIGRNAIGNGANTATIGNSSLLRTYLTGVNLKAGTATAGTAPLKFTSGTHLGTTEAGAMEFDGTHLYFTIANGGSRYQLDQQGGSGANYDILAVTTTGGSFLRLHGSDASTDDVKFASGTNITVAYTDDNTITISTTGVPDGSGDATRLAFWSDTDTLTSDADMTFTTATNTLSVPAISLPTADGTLLLQSDTTTSRGLYNGTTGNMIAGLDSNENYRFGTSLGIFGADGSLWISGSSAKFGGDLTINTIAHEGSDVDKFLVSSTGIIKYRTGAELLSDIGGISSYVNTTYTHLAVTTTGGAFIRLTGSDTTNDDVKLASGTAVTVSYTDDNTITLEHTDTSTQASVNNSGRTYIQDITLDTYGHVTGITSASETVVDTDTTYSVSAVTTTGGALLRLTSSSAATDDVKFASGTNVTVAYTDDNTITISASGGSTTINNNNNNKIITGSDTANTLEGETAFTFDATTWVAKLDRDTTTATDSASLQLRRTRSSTYPNTNDVLGRIDFYSFRTTEFKASIQAVASDNHSTTAGGTDLRFHITKNGLLTQNEILRLDRDSQVTVNPLLDGDTKFIANGSSREILITDPSANRIGINMNSPSSSTHFGGSFAIPYVTKSGNYTLGENLSVVVTASAVELTLPVANTCVGRVYYIKLDAFGYCLIKEGTAGDSIEYKNGSVAQVKLERKGDSLLLVSDGSSKWYATEFNNKKFLEPIHEFWFSPSAGAATNTNIGGAISATGTITLIANANTNRYTRTPRYDIIAASATAYCGFRIGTTAATQQLYTGSSTIDGGFYLKMIGGPTIASNTSCKWFMGVRASTSAASDVEPSSLVSMLGVGFDSTDANVSIMTNDSSGTAGKTSIGVSVPTTDRSALYMLEIWYAPGSTQSAIITVTDLIGGTSFTLVETTSGNLPAANTSMSVFGMAAATGSTATQGLTLGNVNIASGFYI